MKILFKAITHAAREALGYVSLFPNIRLAYGKSEYDIERFTTATVCVLAMDDVGRRLNASYPFGFTENNPSTAASAPAAADAQVPLLKRPRTRFSRAAG